MTQLQANELAQSIEAHFPQVTTQVLPSADTRNAPRHYFIAIRRNDDLTGPSLHIHSPYEWQEAQLAVAVLK